MSALHPSNIFPSAHRLVQQRALPVGYDTLVLFQANLVLSQPPASFPVYFPIYCIIADIPAFHPPDRRFLRPDNPANRYRSPAAARPRRLTALRNANNRPGPASLPRPERSPALAIPRPSLPQPRQRTSEKCGRSRLNIRKPTSITTMVTPQKYRVMVGRLQNQSPVSMLSR